MWTEPGDDTGHPRTLVLPAPAKLNLFLHVTGRRPDGYHLLETVFQFIDLVDSVSLAPRQDDAIRRVGGWDGVPAESDLAIRAARALREATGCFQGVDIRVTKRIPTGAGLGGGSSDAATVLLGLNELWQLGLSRQALQQIGVQLGADVPVFVSGRNAYATGIGDRLEPVSLPPRWYVLVMPATAVATGSVFSAAELTRDTIPITISGFSAGFCIDLGVGSGTKAPGWHGDGSGDRQCGLPGRNDLEPVVAARDQAVASALDRLRVACREAGVPVPERRVRMTGSGACVFALAASQAEARRIASAFDAGSGSNPFREPESGVSEACLAGGPAVVVAGLPEHPLGSRQVG